MRSVDCCGEPARTTLTVFAAASLQPRLTRLRQAPQHPEHRHDVQLCGTQTLTTQLTQGARRRLRLGRHRAHDDHPVRRLASQPVGALRTQPTRDRGRERQPQGRHSFADLARSGLWSSWPILVPAKYAARRLRKRESPSIGQPRATGDGVLSKVRLVRLTPASCMSATS